MKQKHFLFSALFLLLASFTNAQVFSPSLQNLLFQYTNQSKPINQNTIDLQRLIESKNFGNFNTKNRDMAPIQVNNANYSNLENRSDHLPCSKDGSLNCRRELFLGCASSFEDGEVMPSQCKNFPENEYKDLIDYYKENPKATVQNYFDDENAYSIVQINSPQNDTKLVNLFDSEKYGKEKSGWATWFGHDPDGKKFDPLTGTSKFAGFTGLCNDRRNNPGCYQVRDKDTCIVSLPKSTTAELYGDLNRSDMRKLIDSKPLLEIKNTANGKCTVAPLGDVGPGESTGKSIDLTGCVMNRIGGSGMIHTHFRKLENSEQGCSEDKKSLSVGGVIEKIINCNCDKPDKRVMLVSDKTNKKRLIGIFEYNSIKDFNPKEGDEILGIYNSTDKKKSCAIRQNPKDNMCVQKIKGISDNEYFISNISGELIRARVSDRKILNI